MIAGWVAFFVIFIQELTPQEVATLDRVCSTTTNWISYEKVERRIKGKPDKKKFVELANRLAEEFRKEKFRFLRNLKVDQKSRYLFFSKKYYFAATEFYLQSKSNGSKVVLYVVKISKKNGEKILATRVTFSDSPWVIVVGPRWGEVGPRWVRRARTARRVNPRQDTDNQSYHGWKVTPYPGDNAKVGLESPKLKIEHGERLEALAGELEKGSDHKKHGKMLTGWDILKIWDLLEEVDEDEWEFEEAGLELELLFMRFARADVLRRLKGFFDKGGSIIRRNGYFYFHDVKERERRFFAYKMKLFLSDNRSLDTEGPSLIAHYIFFSSTKNSNPIIIAAKFEIVRWKRKRGLSINNFPSEWVLVRSIEDTQKP